MAESLCGILIFWGHDCRVARNGLDALDEASEYFPDIVLIDIGLPGIDGFELAERLRVTGRSRPKLIAMSGYGRLQDLVRGQAAGFDSYLVKPIDLAVLQKLLKDPETPHVAD